MKIPEDFVGKNSGQSQQSKEMQFVFNLVNIVWKGFMLVDGKKVLGMSPVSNFRGVV